MNASEASEREYLTHNRRTGSDRPGPQSQEAEAATNTENRPRAAALSDRQVAAAVLTSLPRMGPATLRRLLGAWPNPIDAIAAVRTERAITVLREGRPHSRRDPAELVRQWRTRLDTAPMAEFLHSRATRVYVTGDHTFPIETGLANQPAVLLAEGERPDALDRPRVAVVGTRAATPHGLTDAYDLGGVLARAGVTVVSGLAIGIDGAAHEGALDARGTAIGVLGTGLDVTYPRRHHQLHDRVRTGGLLMTEYPYGTGPHPGRFPARNRIIASLADVVVIVEATAAGGARITADYAIEYGRDVCVYPGSRRNPSARGTNELLRTGHVVVDPEDVLGVLGLTPGDRRAPAASSVSGSTYEEQAVHRALGGEPATVDELTSRTGLDPGPVAVAVAGLVRGGRIRRANGLLWPL